MRRFFFDYETSLISPGLQAPPVVCLSWAFDEDEPDLHHIRTGLTPGFESYLGSSRKMKDVLLEALKDDQCAMVAYQASYESVVTMAQWPDLAPLVWRKHDLGLWHCPRVRETQIRIAQGDHRDVKGLDDVLRAYGTGIKLDKTNPWRVRYGELLDTPISKWEWSAVDYAVSDIAVREVDREQRRRYSPEYFVDHALQMQSALSLALTTCRGFRTELAACQTLYRDTALRIEEAKEICLANGLAVWWRKGGEMKVKACKKPAEARMIAAFAAMNLPVPRGEPTVPMLLEAYTDNDGHPDPGSEKDARKMKADLKSHGIEVEGNISLDEEACELSQDPVLEAYSEFGRARGLMARVGKMLTAAELGLPVQTSYEVLKNTGRTSSRGGKNPKPGEAFSSFGMNIQNLPKAGEIDE